ncbi:MAG: transposase, partial [Treponema sp.]|nr:transposase [Treponema sp.]
IGEEADETPREASEEISERYGMRFLEAGAEGDHARFLARSVPAYSPAKIVAAIKSVIAGEMFARRPEARTKLRGGGFWTDGHFISTASGHGNGRVTASHVESQGAGGHYKQPRKTTDGSQPSLFPWGKYPAPWGADCLFMAYLYINVNSMRKYTINLYSNIYSEFLAKIFRISNQIL